jgi:hypothetical protein
MLKVDDPVYTIIYERKYMELFKIMLDVIHLYFLNEIPVFLYSDAQSNGRC